MKSITTRLEHLEKTTSTPTSYDAIGETDADGNLLRVVPLSGQIVGPNAQPNIVKIYAGVSLLEL